MYQVIFKADCKSWTDGMKGYPLLRKLSPAQHEKFCNYTLLGKPSKLCSQEMMKQLREIFSESRSLFDI